jgi:LysR family nitrogen assimilation transcriptional regulator
MAFDIRKIEYFLAVVEHRSISAAAESLRISQPTLSRQISALERQFDAGLFVRHGRGVLPTEAGKRLMEGFRGLERQLRSLKDDVADAARQPGGQVALGVPPSPRMLLGMPVISRFCGAYPQVALRISEETSGDLRDLVASGEIDLAITNSEEPAKGLVTEPLATEPMLLIGPRSARLSMQTHIALSRAADLPLVLTAMPNSLRRLVERGMNRHGLQPRLRIEANTLPLMTDLVEAGLGYTILPSCGALSLVNSGRLSASPLQGLDITWTIARSGNRVLSVSAELLLALIRDVVAELAGSASWPMARSELARNTRHPKDPDAGPSAPSGRTHSRRRKRLPVPRRAKRWTTNRSKR